MRKNLLVWFFIGLIVFINDNAWAYWEDVHERITNEMIRQNIESVDSWIKNFTGLSGADAFVNGQKIRKWIADGSIKEDEHVSPLVTARYLNHFYDPLTGLGLTDAPYFGTSSYIWASNDGHNAWRWEMARSHFYDGLTKTAKTDRDEAFSKAFRSIGQVMHLVQDLAVPAHVRNDAHPTGDLYELWTRGNVAALDYTIIPFPYWNASISSSAPKQFWANSGNGLAEYTNANFLSEGTIFKNYSHPSLANTNFSNFNSVPISTVTLPDSTVLNALYISGYGKQHLAQLNYFSAEIEGMQLPYLMFTLDDECHKDYAQELIPRAVGYSAGLLNYFFRGQLGAGLVSRMVTTDEVASGIKIKNQSNETMTSYTDPATGRVIGNIEVYYDAVVSNGTSTTTERRLLRNCPLSTTDCWPTAPLQLAPNQETEAIFFPIPAEGINPSQYTVVFRGQLGNEQGAVMAGRINYWSEEWDGDSLKSNHIWRTWPEYRQIFDAYREQFRHRTNEVMGGKLIQEHRSGITSSNSVMAAEANDMRIMDPSYTGSYRYCLSFHPDPEGGCEKYDFGPDFPIRVTPNTVVQIKVDEMSITPPMEQDDPICDFYHYSGTSHAQAIELSFANQHDMYIATLNFAVRGQEPVGASVLLVPGQSRRVNIYQELNYFGLPIQEPMYIRNITIYQSLAGGCPFERTQRMEVDYIRIAEEAPQ